MESMMNLPDDVVKQELFHYLSVNDIMRLDLACMNHEYRPKLLEKINGVILSGDSDISMDASLFKWLGLKKIYLINMYFHLSWCLFMVPLSKSETPIAKSQDAKWRCPDLPRLTLLLVQLLGQ